MQRLIITFILFVGCSSVTDQIMIIPVSWHDNPDKKIIEISIHNQMDRAVCTDSQNWPNQAGRIHYASDIVKLVIDSANYKYRDFDTGYCPKCGNKRLPPGSTLNGTLSYDDFDIPKNIYNHKKTLIYELKGWYCR